MRKSLPIAFLASLCFVGIAFQPVAAQTHFSHVIFIIQENRTPDNLFGSNPTFEPGVDLATSGLNTSNQTIPLTPVALASCYGVGHTHDQFEFEYNNGLMNGFNKGGVQGEKGCVLPANPQYVYADNSTGIVQPYFDIATSYGWANRMFQSNQGSSFPAHQFLMSGTSAPSTTSDLFAANEPAGGTFAGCASESSVYEEMIAPDSSITRMYPCFSHDTLVDLLNGAGLTWRYYAITGKAVWNAPYAISALCDASTVNGKLQCGGAEWANVTLKPSTVLTDIGKCNLADVTWVTPTGQNSDHPQNNNGGGPSWVASIVNAIGNSTCGYWQNTAILITWDDWGGWYDHVPPFRIGQSNGWGQSYVYGFRVPLLVVSAYTPAGYVDNTIHDFGSLLRFTENNFGLGLIGPGTWADSYADDMSEFFTLNTPRTFSTIPSLYTAEHFINSTEIPTDPDDD
jgi:phospholipase C